MSKRTAFVLFGAVLILAVSVTWFLAPRNALHAGLARLHNVERVASPVAFGTRPPVLPPVQATAPPAPLKLPASRDGKPVAPRPEILEPRTWIEAMKGVAGRLKDDKKYPARSRVVRTDCSEMPCISYIEIEGLAAKTGEDPVENGTALAAAGSKYFDDVVRDSLDEFFSVGRPVIQSAVTGPNKVVIAIAFVPLDNPISPFAPEGQTIKTDQPLQYDQQTEAQTVKRIAQYLRP